MNVKGSSFLKPLDIKGSGPKRRFSLPANLTMASLNATVSRLEQRDKSIEDIASSLCKHTFDQNDSKSVGLSSFDIDAIDSQTTTPCTSPRRNNFSTECDQNSALG